MAVIVFYLLRTSSPWVWIVGALAVLATFAFETSSVILTATARNAIAAKLSMVAGFALQGTTIVVAIISRSAMITFTAELAAGALGPMLNSWS